MDDRVILYESIVRSLQVPHSLLRQPLRVDTAADACFTGSSGIVGQGVRVRSHSVVLLGH